MGFQKNRVLETIFLGRHKAWPPSKVIEIEDRWGEASKQGDPCIRRRRSGGEDAGGRLFLPN